MIFDRGFWPPSNLVSSFKVGVWGEVAGVRAVYSVWRISSLAVEIADGCGEKRVGCSESGFPAKASDGRQPCNSFAYDPPHTLDPKP